MILFKRADDLTRWLLTPPNAGRRVGFVPTMGALHEGHISLIAISKKTTALTISSIFVNPTQFNDPRDFQKYPVTLEKDIELLEQAGTDALFLPGLSELYSGGTAGLEHYDLGSLETVLEGKYRPGHFQGVCQVMRRLLDIVRPDDLFMGSKDYQQCMVIQRLLEILGMSSVLHRCPIVREPDGLAMSSRNLRLNPEERLLATGIHSALLTIRDAWAAGEAPGECIAKAIVILGETHFRIDYVSIVNDKTLEPLSPWQKEAVALIAAFQGEVRLIDNMNLL